MTARHKHRTRNLILSLLGAAAIVVVLIIELSSGVQRVWMRSSMLGAAELAEVELREKIGRFFTPLENHLKVTEAWGQHGVLDLANHRRLNTLFIPMLEQFPQVTSMLLANELGVEYMLLRDESTWITRYSDADLQPGQLHWQRWAGLDSLLNDWQEERIDYDPRLRPWFQAAMDSLNADDAGICMTAPYRFFTQRQLGITLSKKWYPPQPDAPAHVTALDVPLQEILALADSLRTPVDSHNFLLAATGYILTGDDVIPTSAQEDSGRLRPGTRDPDDLEAAALAAWRNQGEPSDQPFRCSHEGQKWWADIRPITENDSAPWLAILVPEASFQDQVRNRQHLAVLATAGTLLLGIMTTLAMSRLVGRSKPATDSEDLFSPDKLRELIAQGEGDELEFKSTLRWNLNQDKPGKEVEMSWLKTVVAYLNTEGGVVLIGVSDEGELLGLENDRFTNDDKFLLHFNNLIKQHIGLEHSAHIHGEICSVDDLKLFVIQCRKATKPVYLKHGKEEKFFIRVGPSSRQLAMSEVVERFRKNGA